MLYLYVGCQGKNPRTNDSGKTYVAAEGGWNGGGAGDYDHCDDECAGGGGGATDIRLVNGNWDIFNSLKSRIMVAAGGGGSGTHTGYLIYGGYGGGLIGGNGNSTSYDYGVSANANTGGGQTSTGSCARRPQSDYPNDYGAFGYANQTVVPTNDGYGGGGGGGWYGGVKGHGRGGSGGSSFISGHTGCNAINPSTGAHLGASTTMTINNVNYRFTNTVMKAGNEVMPSPSGGTETGHSGNGYCKITWHPAL